MTLDRTLRVFASILRRLNPADNNERVGINVSDPGPYFVLTSRGIGDVVHCRFKVRDPLGPSAYLLLGFCRRTAIHAS
jgi:hypothetical protein